MPRDLETIHLDTDIEAAVALLDQPRSQPQFSLSSNRFHRAKAADQKKRRGIKSLIRPENAASVLAHLPADSSERTHCLLRGDFVLCDLIPAIVALRGRCRHLRIATLGMSVANADTLAVLVESGLVGALTIVVSHYFQQVDKTTVFRAVASRLDGLARLAVTRSHAKVICLPTFTGDHFVIEGSANLRSSDNIEQMLITNDPATHDFHAEWLDELAGKS
jgi:hypothetical protein